MTKLEVLYAQKQKNLLRYVR